MTESKMVENLLTENGFDWAVRAYHPSSDAGTYYLGKLTSLREFMTIRGMGQNAPTLDGLDRLGKSNPYKRDAFLEALVSMRSSEMITAAWRMIQGMQLQSLQLCFENATTFSMEVQLNSPYDEVETYATTDIDDMNFVRHLMKSKSGERPIINGFFALRRPKS